MYKDGEEVLIKAKVLRVSPSIFGYECEIGRGSNRWVLEITEDIVLPGKTYTQGFADAFAVADKLNRMPLRDIVKLFGIEIGREEVFSAIPPQEALTKIEAYEKEKEIKVGDVVECNGFKGVVLHIFHSGSLNIVYENGIIDTLASVQECEKTGKHIDIDSLLRQIGE